jgi:hypothetical protein
MTAGPPRPFAKSSLEMLTALRLLAASLFSGSKYSAGIREKTKNEASMEMQARGTENGRSALERASLREGEPATPSPPALTSHSFYISELDPRPLG